ncbi:unnamed protein product [Adineta steineri]|uniref:Uncharacterized protein n=1 Tax=Adineta steineri TaxID=433720 RepID=A0A815HTY5_9BILA|nr:unnamed protein product [Adineta steineri]CAF1043754.1 unnamed protein product [Adineta steineri]CAF1357171.1 unnamed protein product [Adineta steineri]CAF1599087.1 unnamed protein product [Adineta steineri]
MFITNYVLRAKRELIKTNLGGHETNAHVAGDDNKINFYGKPESPEETTLIRKAGDQVSKILEGGTSIVVAPAKWLANIQDNW